MSDEQVRPLNLWEKLAFARVELQNKKIKKSGLNKFSNFRYYELRDFIPHVNIIFRDAGLVTKFNIDDKNATLEVINCQAPTERETFSTPTADAGVKGSTPIQSLGSEHTYLKRYLYLNLLEISENDVVDTLGENDKANTDLADIDQLTKIKELYTQEELDVMLARLKKTESQLTVDQAQKMIDARGKNRKPTKAAKEQSEPRVGIDDLK